MQCTGNSGCFPRGKRTAIVRCYPVFWGFSCVQYFRVSVIQLWTLTIGSLTCVRSYACVYTRGWGTSTTSRHNIRKNSHKLFLCCGRDSNLWSWNPLNLEADALPIEPPPPGRRRRTTTTRRSKRRRMKSNKIRRKQKKVCTGDKSKNTYRWQAIKFTKTDIR